MSNIFKRTTGGGGSGIITIDGDTGSVTGSTITITGGSTGFTFSGSGTTLTMEGAATYYSLTPYIVGPDVNSQYTTIGAAISAAITAGVSSTSPANIYVKPQSGGYTENETLVDGINLVAFGQQVLLTGKLSMSTTGAASVNGFFLQTNGDYIIEVTGADSIQLTIDDCYLNMTNNSGVLNSNSNADTYIDFQQTDGDLGTTGIQIFNHTGPGLDFGDNCNFTNSGLSTVASTYSAGGLQTRFSSYNSGFTFSGSAASDFLHSDIYVLTDNPALTINSTSGGGNNSHNARFNSGSASAISIGAGAITTITNSEIISINTNAIAGSGTFQYALNCFLFSSGIEGTLTLTPLATII